MKERKLRGTVLLAVASVGLAGAATALGAFGTGGKVVVNAGGVNSAEGVTLGKGGTIVGAGSAVPGATSFDFAVVRLDSSGTPDSIFSGDGEQTTNVGGSDHAEAAVVQKDGAIVAGGSSDAVDDQSRATMVRYEPDGDPDPTFAGDGIQIFGLGGVASSINDVALQKDGKIVVAGSIEASNGGQDAMVARVKPNGKLDRSFGRRGVTRFGAEKGTGLAAVAIHEGRIAVAGDTSGTGMGDPSSQVYARLTKAGELDKSFSKDGIYTKKVKDSSSRAEDLAVDKNGRLLAAVGIFGPESGYGVAAVKESGKLAKKFGKDGFALRDFGEDTSLVSIAVQKAGGIVIGGGVRSSSGDFDFVVARFTTKGKLDESFGFKGATVTDFVGNSDLIRGLAVGKQDEIVAAGIGDGDFGFARYLANGSIDD